MHLTFQQLTKGADGSLFIPSFLKQVVKSISRLIYGTVKVVTLTADTRNDFIHEPGVSAASSLAAQLICIFGAKFIVPAADRLIGH